jgi:hypothetical protein
VARSPRRRSGALLLPASHDIRTLRPHAGVRPASGGLELANTSREPRSRPSDLSINLQLLSITAIVEPFVGRRLVFQCIALLLSIVEWEIGC